MSLTTTPTVDQAQTPLVDRPSDAALNAGINAWFGVTQTSLDHEHWNMLRDRMWRSTQAVMRAADVPNQHLATKVGLEVSDAVGKLHEVFAQLPAGETVLRTRVLDALDSLGRAGNTCLANMGDSRLAVLSAAELEPVVRQAAADVVALARVTGHVVTIELTPTVPLAMGRYVMTVDVRAAK